MSSATIANEISLKGIERHAKIQNYGLKYLFNQGYICAAEITIDNYRFDIVGYNRENGQVVILEAKASVGDLRIDKKLINYKELQ
ncbi:MmcB family DNA repair protein [Clostridium sp. UBA4548]|uniref:MmcB family DNA repair protein n=1 Tax=Clostridium sp. UBA4548 TaxID=1946361 RepID=UPI0025C72521|nr:MmcB family DNA repair protein [Clostridium sp. UBA4548]